MNPIDFGFSECRMYIFFTRVNKKIVHMHYSQWRQIIVSASVSKRCILLNSKLMRALQVTVVHIASILVNLRYIVFYKSTKSISKTLQPTESNYKKYASVLINGTSD